MDDLLEVLTHCEFHPKDPSLFLYTSSRGYFSLCDLREPVVTTSNKKFDCLDQETLENTFSEVICSVTSANFNPSNGF
jgi:hypothetical protein